MTTSERWPALPYAAWKDTKDTLHLWTQIVGKVRLALTPWLNHSWHVALYVSARGLTTGPIPYAEPAGTSGGLGEFEMEFDFIDHALMIRTSGDHTRQVLLRPTATKEFHGEVMKALRDLGIAVTIDPRPSEIPGAIPFNTDGVHASYDRDAAHTFWRALLATHQVFTRFRTGFLGKASPVHFFWGSFDLAVTRFSGRTAPPHPGGVPGLSDDVACEAYSHEVSSAGFWPGGGGYDEAAFYSYAYPGPQGFADARVKPQAAFWSKPLGEFLLPYEAVRTARDPDAALMDFLVSTYEAAASLAKWDRKALECAMGQPGQCRVV
ncbi:MAG: DUF5996 family protein [Xanthobacteraceae bacterium]|uniref:DUF5996 family protein n=1 Tax=Pseudolabrys sp. TaxID=1960880 RepID=UPI003D0F9398